MTLPQLPLTLMDDRQTGLTPSMAANYLDAARVCLDRHHTPPNRHHTPPTEFKIIHDDREFQIEVDWLPSDDRALKAWANQDDATRDTAYACALAAVELSCNLVALQRAETRTGADYYVAAIGQTLDDLENCFRLEVSGTDLGSAEVRRRLQEKVAQARRGNSNLPAIAAVLGFRAKLIMISSVG